MLTQERKDELIGAADYALNKYIEKKSVMSNIAYDLAKTSEELDFMKGLETQCDVFEVL